MSKPAARLTDMHVCPKSEGRKPHVGGPISGLGCTSVLIAGLPAARAGDTCVCIGPPDTIAVGSTGVIIGGKPAARMGDACAHGGKITMGCATVLIGESEKKEDNQKELRALEIRLDKTLFLPLGIVDYDGKIENNKIKFEIIAKKGMFSGLTFKINCDGAQFYSELIPKELTEGEKYTIIWDGFSSKKTYDSTLFLNEKLIAEVTDGTTNSQLKITGKYKIVEWADVKIDDNSKKVDVTLRTNLQEGEIDKKVCKTFTDLMLLAQEGLRKHWGRNKHRITGKSVKVRNSEYEVFINPVNTKEKSMPRLPVLTTYSNERSSNWWLRRRLFYNVHKNADDCFLNNSVQKDSIIQWRQIRDDSFKDTSAHEVGHEILRAFAGVTNVFYSYLHKGTSTWDQDIKENNKLPTIDEIDLMEYHSDDKTEQNRKAIKFYERRVASMKDVLGLLWCSQLIVSSPVASAS